MGDIDISEDEYGKIVMKCGVCLHLLTWSDEEMAWECTNVHCALNTGGLTDDQ